MELADNACEKHLVLLAGAGPAGKGVNEFCWLWEAGSSLLSWSSKVIVAARARDVCVCGEVMSVDSQLLLTSW